MREIIYITIQSTKKLANFVINNFSSGLSTLPVIKILPSKTLVLTDSRYFLSVYETCDFVGLSRSSLYRKEMKGEFPKKMDMNLNKLKRTI